jgi:hypothetical protein
MLDHSLVLLCSEVSDGNTHSHATCPSCSRGAAAGRHAGPRADGYDGRRHGDLLATIAQAMGADVDTWGDAGTGALPGLLG